MPVLVIVNYCVSMKQEKIEKGFNKKDIHTGDESFN